MSDIKPTNTTRLSVSAFAPLDISVCRNGYLYLYNKMLYLCEPSDDLSIIPNSNITFEKHEIEGTLHFIKYYGEINNIPYFVGIVSNKMKWFPGLSENKAHDIYQITEGLEIPFRDKPDYCIILLILS